MRMALVALAFVTGLAPISGLCAQSSVIVREEAGIPQTPSAPPSLQRGMVTDITRCQRHFTWKGKTYDCDSFYRYDGDGLRPMVQDVPDAIAILDDYQRTRRNIRAVGFVATGGLVVAGLAFLASRVLFPAGSTDALLVRNIGVIGGGAVSIGAFTTGFVISRANESRINQIVDTYNLAKPDSPIVLQFSTGFNL